MTGPRAVDVMPAAVAALVARARSGEPLDDLALFDALASLDAPGAAHPPSLARVRDALAPGRRAGGFYLADAFGEDVARARAAYAEAERDVAARRDAVAAGLRALCGIDAVADEIVVPRARFDGDLPPGVVLLRETATHRVAAIAVDAGAREAARRALERAEADARRSLGEAVRRIVDAP